MDLAQLLSYSKDVILAVAAIVGAVVAVRGLRTWNRQLKGGTEYELTRRLLKNTYRLREAMALVRHPFMSAAEMPEPPEDERNKMTRDQRVHYGSVRGYEKRWEPVVAARTDLQTDLLEAEVLWGSGVHSTFAPVFKLQHELYVRLHTYLRASDPGVPERTRDALHVLLEKVRDVLYGMPGSEDDVFAKDFAAAIGAIEVFLKPHLRK